MRAISQAIRPFGLESQCRLCDGIGCPVCGEYPKPKRKNKYNVAPVAERTCDDIIFASKAEMRRYSQLKLLERAGHIARLELQPVYSVAIAGKHICSYIADFRYFELSRPAAEQRVVEDVKGVETVEFRLKRKLVEAMFPGTKITIVK